MNICGGEVSFSRLGLAPFKKLKNDFEENIEVRPGLIVRVRRTSLFGTAIHPCEEGRQTIQTRQSNCLQTRGVDRLRNDCRMSKVTTLDLEKYLFPSHDQRR